MTRVWRATRAADDDEDDDAPSVPRRHCATGYTRRDATRDAHRRTRDEEHGEGTSTTRGDARERGDWLRKNRGWRGCACANGCDRAGTCGRARRRKGARGGMGRCGGKSVHVVVRAARRGEARARRTSEGCGFSCWVRVVWARDARLTTRAREQVKWFNISKGFGFIVPDDGSEEIFVHQTALHSEGFRSLKEVRAKRARANFEIVSERRRHDANAERVLTARMF